MAAVCPQKPAEQEVTVDWDAEKGVTLSVPDLNISVTKRTVKEAVNALKEKLREHYQVAS